MGSIAKFKLTPKLSGLFGKGKAQSIYMVFRNRMKAKETLRFQSLATDDRMLVDCGHDGYPVALQFISAKGIPPSKEQQTFSDKDFGDAVADLFLFATEMIRYHEANMQRQGNALIKDAISVIMKVPSSKIDKKLRKDLVPA